MFCDEAVIHIQAGNGGNGCISFHREKYVPRGAPDGGDGGQGGSIVFQVNGNLNTLSDFRSRKHFNAPKGTPGTKNNSTGEDGANLILEVPEGTQIFNKENGELIIDLKNHKEHFEILKGGRKGLGNARFANSIHQAPEIAELGEPGKSMEIRLELKLIADVALIGLPNAGKSTLISSISNARPKIANYPFTTIIPNLGVVTHKGEHFVVCDIPGLIKDAHKGKGLGDKFLKHIERTKILIHIIDANDTNYRENYKTINNELKSFSKKLSQKKQIVAFNKIDLFDEEWTEFIEKEFKKKYRKTKKIFSISAVSKKGQEKLLNEILKKLREEKERIEQEKPEEKEEVIILRPHEGPKMDNYEIIRKRKKIIIKGTRIEQLISMTDFTQRDAPRRIYNTLIKVGIQKALKKMGLEEGGTFYIGDTKLKFRDS